jgi:hypothetical protein
MLNKSNIIIVFTVVLIGTFLSFFFHEMAHWAAYELLGYDAGFTLNTANIKDKSISLPKKVKLIASAAGPVFTIIQALFFFFFLNKKKSFLLYPFLFIPFSMRLAAGFANVFGPNDEGRVSLYLNLPMYVIPILVILFLFYLVYKITKKNNYRLKDNLIIYGFSLIGIITVVFLDQKFNLQFI